MDDTGGGPDFVTIDGGEGGTGAAPLAFADHVALPFKLGFAHVYSTFARRGLAEDVVFVGSGRLGFPDAALFAFALGCDLINVGREAMMSIGCIQAQRCHTGRCPTGVATQNRWLMRGLDPDAQVPPRRQLPRPPCAPSCSPWPAPAASPTPPWSPPTTSRSSASATAPPRCARSSATTPTGR